MGAFELGQTITVVNKSGKVVSTVIRYLPILLQTQPDTESTEQAPSQRLQRSPVRLPGAQSGDQSLPQCRIRRSQGLQGNDFRRTRRYSLACRIAAVAYA